MILNYHRKRASQNEQRLYFHILDQALYVKATQGEIKTYADAVKRVIRQLILSSPEESTELSERLDLKVNQSRPLSMSESAINTEKDIDDLLHRFDVQGHALEPTAFVSPLAVLFRSFLRNEEHRQHASQAIDNFYLYAALEAHPDIMTYMIYHFLLNDMGSAHIDFIVKGPMDHSRFLNISGLMFEALRSQPQYAYNKVYQAVLLMERERGRQ